MQRRALQLVRRQSVRVAVAMLQLVILQSINVAVAMLQLMILQWERWAPGGMFWFVRVWEVMVLRVGGGAGVRTGEWG